ncbi:DNA-binding transcriptional regulator, MocR family, contains an aminotransferase domain [Nonomuraea solani]|uniref:DNA-binding transcriptional regulator, MocR family, contains an aminotransferase domain n=1 Tax=Nonomuraea solani TaxID=1144553 RepID=A0A1H6EV75_9ACTN|nr:PLP-dependent aminotransferase family protein [Nonomuraea solani]SEH00759.1 DNA-binding transcriptional regulator, MocR family, contains an aminotransferase domain [Nonomuraea solani]
MRHLSATQVARLVQADPAARPYYRALADGVRALIMDGQIPVRVRMPAERHLAETLKVSRTTVTAAYDLLRERGYLESRQGSGSWTALPDPATAPDNPWLSADGDGLVQLQCAAPPAPAVLREAMIEAVDDIPRYGMGNGYDPMGLPVLRERIAAYYTAKGVATRPEQIIVTTGSQHALQLVIGLLVRPGDAVVVESPTYPHPMEAARHRGARIVPVGISHEGWQQDLVAGAMRQSGARLAYLMPDFHNPTGALMEDPVRAAVAGAARRAGTMLLVDETWGELALDDVPPTSPMAAFDTDSRVISVGSASKLWWGGLRIGWVRTTAALARSLALFRSSVDIASPVLEQLVVARLFDRLEETRAERRRTLRASRDALVSGLREHLPEWTFAVPRGGGTLWVRLDTAATPLAEAALAHGLRLAPGPWFGLEGTLEGYLRLPFTHPPGLLAEAITRLRAARDHGPTGTPLTPDSLIAMV